jgi:acyl-CoA thioesterase-1
MRHRSSHVHRFQMRDRAIHCWSRRTFFCVVGGIVAISPSSFAAPPIRLLVLGDSLTAGFGVPRAEGFQVQLGAALKESGFDVVVIDGAVSGATSIGGLARLDLVWNQGFDAAIVELGANDAMFHLVPAVMERNLNSVLDRLAERRVKVLLSGMRPEVDCGPDYTKDYLAVFDRLSERPGLIYDSFFLQGVYGVPALNLADGLHPNAAGIARIADRLLPLVVQLLGEVQPR